MKDEFGFLYHSLKSYLCGKNEFDYPMIPTRILIISNERNKFIFDTV